MERNINALLIILTIVLGLISRLLNTGISILDNYLGDALYAVLIYLIISLFLPHIKRFNLLIMSLLVVYSIEFFQLSDIPLYLTYSDFIIYRLLGFALGNTFYYADLISYTVGILVVHIMSFAIPGWQRD